MTLTQVTLVLAEVTLQPNLGFKGPFPVLKADKLKHGMPFRNANRFTQASMATQRCAWVCRGNMLINSWWGKLAPSLHCWPAAIVTRLHRIVDTFQGLTAVREHARTKMQSLPGSLLRSTKVSSDRQLAAPSLPALPPLRLTGKVSLATQPS